MAHRDRRGVAAAEFALIGSILVTLLFAVYDIGNAVRQQLMMQQALRAGGQYAAWFPTQTDLITQVVQTALPSTQSWSGLNVTACTCGGGNGASSCGAATSCPAAGAYVVLHASVPWSLFLLKMSSPTNAANYVIRVQ